MGHQNANNETSNEDWKQSKISRTTPSYKNNKLVSNRSWLKGKNADDEAEGLWRIYDTLYDLTPFIEQHPGGSFWLKTTKGTDITEPFETHHIKGISPLLLQKYKVRQASKPRNYTLTLNENGFYRTLKRRVAAKVDHLDYSPAERSDFLHLCLLTSTLVCSVLAARYPFTLFEPLAALSLCWLSIAAHNYFHQKDNWRMYTFNLTLMNFSEWRISHALSHHVYPNSLYDMEMSLFEPLLCWVPNKHISSKLRRIASLFIQPVIYLLMYPSNLIERMISTILAKNELFWHDAIGFSLPALMLLFSSNSVAYVLLQWASVICLGSFIFTFIGLNAGHHTPSSYHDGDATREDRDWGLYQLDTVIDRFDIKGSQFMVLTHFGEHALHHLFPTLDHGVLPQLYPELRQTMEEFQGELRQHSLWQNVFGQHQQLLRTEPNIMPPCQRAQKLQ